LRTRLAGDSRRGHWPEGKVRSTAPQRRAGAKSQ
jgi:hypothetical protein